MGQYQLSSPVAGRSRTTAGWRNHHNCPVCCDTAGRRQASDAPEQKGEFRQSAQHRCILQTFVFLTSRYGLIGFIIITCVSRFLTAGSTSWVTSAPPSLIWRAGDSLRRGAILGCLVGVLGGPDLRGLILTSLGWLGVWGLRRRRRLLQPSSAASWTVFSFF